MSKGVVASINELVTLGEECIEDIRNMGKRPTTFTTFISVLDNLGKTISGGDSEKFVKKMSDLATLHEKKKLLTDTVSHWGNEDKKEKLKQALNTYFDEHLPRLREVCSKKLEDIKKKQEEEERAKTERRTNADKSKGKRKVDSGEESENEEGVDLGITLESPNRASTSADAGRKPRAAIKEDSSAKRRSVSMPRNAQVSPRYTNLAKEFEYNTSMSLVAKIRALATTLGSTPRFSISRDRLRCILEMMKLSGIRDEELKALADNSNGHVQIDIGMIYKLSGMDLVSQWWLEESITFRQQV
jgi:hypothetical protein